MAKIIETNRNLRDCAHKLAAAGVGEQIARGEKLLRHNGPPKAAVCDVTVVYRRQVLFMATLTAQPILFCFLLGD